MSAAAIRTKIIDYLQKNGNVGPAGLSDGQDLIADGVIDSFGLLALINYLEDEFALRIDASQVDPANFNTVERIVAVVAKTK